MVNIDNAVKQAQSSYESVDATRQARTYAEVALNAEMNALALPKRRSSCFSITRKTTPSIAEETGAL